MRKKFFSRGVFGLALLMLFGLTLPTWGQGITYGLTGKKLTFNDSFKDLKIQDGALIALRASSMNKNFIKGDANNVPTFEGAATTFRVKKVGSTGTFTLQRVNDGKYIKKPEGYSNVLVQMTTDESAAAKITASDAGSGRVRFTEKSVHNKCHLNTNDVNKPAKWFTGEGGYSYFLVYEVQENYSPPVFDETKAFLVITDGRGTLAYDAANKKLHFVEGTGNEADPNQKFAIVKDGTTKYLYSYGADKFVASDYYRSGNRLTALPIYTLAVLNAQSAIGKYAYKFQLTGGGNTNVVNINSNAGVTINHYTTEDEGNRFYLKNIEETVQSAEILKNAYNAAIATVKAQNDGVTVSEGTSAEDAKTKWNEVKTQARLKAGFYRLQGPAGKYLTAGDKGAALTMGTTKGEQTIFYYNGESEKNLVALSNGYSLHNANLGGTPADGDALTIRVEDGDTYTLQGGETYLTHNANNSVAKDSKQEKCEFRLESVAEISVTLHNGEATFYTPVAVSVSEGTTAYKGSVSGSTLTLTALNGTIPANTPFFLKGEEANCTLTVTTGGTAIENNAFKGSVKTRTQTSGKSTYVLSDAEFKLLGEGVNCRGFRAQVETETNSGVQGFTLEFDNITAIESVETPTDNTPVFDLSGRRVAKTVKGGIYLRNGKKFVQ